METTQEQAQLLERAIALALRVHQGQRDKAGAPYILHPLRVMLAVQGVEARMAAVLHDVVEDGDVTLEQLTGMGFPPAVVAAVEALTRRPDEEYPTFVARAAAHPIARQVKRADLEDNLDLRRIAHPTQRDLERMVKYRRAWESLRETAPG